MKPVVTEWTIVVAGSWNLAILNPEWFGRKIFDAAQIEVELVLENFHPRLRFLHESVLVIPQADKVIFGARHATDAAIRATEQSADRLLRELPVTPISALGINFGFTIDEPSENLAELFRLNDADQFAERAMVIEDTSITRRIRHAEFMMNLTMRLDAQGSGVV